MNKQLKHLLSLVAVFAFISGCTKSRKAELPEDQQSSVLAISEFGGLTGESPFKVKITSELQSQGDNSPLAMSPESKAQVHEHEVEVPSRMKFMFKNMPLMNMTTRDFDVVFTVDQQFVTAYKVAPDISQLTLLEKTLATTANELQSLTTTQRAAPGQVRAQTDALNRARAETQKIRVGQARGTLLVPLFKYRVESFGQLVRAKNDLKEETSQLQLKTTEWTDATHIQLSPQADNRLMVGMGPEQSRALSRVFSADRINHQKMSAEELQSRFKIAMRFVEPNATVFTRLDTEVMHVYEITTRSALNENQLRLLNNQAGNQEVISCQDSSVAQYINDSSSDCVLVLKANVPIAYKTARLQESDNGSTMPNIVFEDATRDSSNGLVEIKENVVAAQVDVSGVLDPNSALKISDLSGEFYFRRTLESASSMFNANMIGLSGDMVVVSFSLENDRLVVRNQMSLIAYTGQGPRDREELMSFPVKYLRVVNKDATGNTLTVPKTEETTKERAEYAVINWTQNTIPTLNSPLAFYGTGQCFAAASALNVTDMDMRLNTAGILNFSLDGSYTMAPDDSCVAFNEVRDSLGGSTGVQLNFNVKERISFMKKKNASDDVQFTENISSTSQGAFNFGFFTLNDLVTENGRTQNRDGGQKHMPMVHDFRTGQKLVYHLGGLNNPETTPPERREVLVQAAQQVVAEWNRTLHYSFKDTPLARRADATYIELVVDDASTETHLGDLDRNYIWFHEFPLKDPYLGVAQPAANPRSGTIISSNVIIFTGNIYMYNELELRGMLQTREYEQNVARIKAAKVNAYEAQQAQNNPVASATAPAPTAAPSTAASSSSDATDPTPDTDGSTQTRIAGARLQTLTAQAQLSADQMEQISQALHIGGPLKRHLSRNTSLAAAAQQAISPSAARQIMRNLVAGNKIKPQKISYTVNEKTFMKKIAELVTNQELKENPFEYESAVAQVFIQYGGLNLNAKQALQRRQRALASSIRFYNNIKQRPGCFNLRTDNNDSALNLDPDPKKNLLLNFKVNVMSTLSHEIGHALGLRHNFRASIDRANYEFEGEQTGRNYSSIMDYMPDIDQKYKGPGPYDAHAIRAAYTGLIELNENFVKSENFAQLNIPVVGKNLASIKTIAERAGSPTFVHLTKDTLNAMGVLRHYEQCDDGDVGSSAFCARHDTGSSAVDIVKNVIQDYNRMYASQYYVYNRISFGWPEKMQIVMSKADTFQHIRSFLDEALILSINGSGRTESETGMMMEDLLSATKIGYEFLHETIRTPSINAPVMREILRPEQARNEEELAQARLDAEMDRNGDGLVPNEERFDIVDTGLKTADNKPYYKLVESRSMYDIQMNGGDRDKLNTIGITYDKTFAMIFLLESSNVPSTGEQQNSQISYSIYEKYVLGNDKPENSLTVRTLLDILNDNLTYGFFAPTADYGTVDFREASAKVPTSYLLRDQSAVMAVLGMAENRQSAFDPFADAFKISRSTERNAPADRANVVKPGQQRGLGDTRVFFASQNAVASNGVIQEAARNEFYHTNKASLSQLFEQLYLADSKPVEAYNAAIKAACPKPAADAQTPPNESPECAAAKAKTLAQFTAENPELKASKEQADQIAAALVASLRAQNTRGQVIDKDMDKPASPANLEKQVAMLRRILVSQIGLIKTALQILGETPEAALDDTIGMLQDVLAQQKQQNSQMEKLQLFASAFDFIGKFSESLEVELQTPNKQKIKGSVIAGLMMSQDIIENNYNKQLELIDQLALFTAAVDPDSVSP